jgi:hypothetical protein
MMLTVMAIRLETALGDAVAAAALMASAFF